MLLGILAHKNDWNVPSNQESGDGFSDVTIKIAGTQVGIVIELKY